MSSERSLAGCGRVRVLMRPQCQSGRFAVILRQSKLLQNDIELLRIEITGSFDDFARQGYQNLHRMMVDPEQIFAKLALHGV